MQQTPRFDTTNSKITGQMIYLDAESQKDLYRSYQPSPEEIEQMKVIVSAVWDKISNLELPDITKYPQNYSGILQFQEDLLSGNTD